MKKETQYESGKMRLPGIRQLSVFWCCLLAILLLVAPNALAQISGPSTVCSGVASTFTLSGTPNPSYTYTWSVIPPGNSTILTSSPGSATIQWFNTIAASEMVQVVIVRPGMPTQTWTKTVNIVPEPDPQISTNSKVACQGTEIDKDKRQEEGSIIDDGACLKVCANSTPQYTVMNGLPGSTFQWTIDPSKGAFSGSSSGTSVYINWYDNLGFTFVKVKETTAAGCTKEKTVCINIIETPKPLFSVNGDTQPLDECFYACTKSNIQFADLTPDPSSSPIVSWQWDFGDGTYSSLQNPTHAYTNPGVYKVVLEVTNQCGCKGYYAVCIKVSDPERPPLEIYCPSIVCENAIGHYTIDNTCSDMYWEVNGGTIVSSTSTSIDIMWDNVGPSGFGEIIANFSNCGGNCGPKVTAQVPVILANGTIEGKTVICKGKQYKYTLPKWPATNFTWSVTPVGAATLTSYDINSYEVNLIAYAPFTLHCEYKNTMELCAGKADLNINVVNPVVLSAPSRLCVGTPLSVVGTMPATTGTSYTYINPAGTAITSGTFNVAGSWTVQATNPSYCDIAPISVQVVNAPAAVSSITGEQKVCLNTPYVYEIVAPIPNTICNWSVTGGTIVSSSGNAATVTWISSGTKTITVSRTWADIPACNSPAISLNVSTATPVASISGNSSPCANTSAVYTATLSGSSSPIDNITWSLSNPAVGSVSSGQNTMTPTFTWNNATAASTPVTIIATLVKCGTTVTVSYPITVIGIPIVSVSAPASVCSGIPVTFTSTTTPAGATVNWTLPAGTTPPTVPSGPSATVTFTNLGLASQNFTVAATVSAPGCPGTSTAHRTIAVKPQPNINVSPGAGPTTTIYACVPPDSVNMLLSTNATTSIKWFRNGTNYLSGATSSKVGTTGTYRVDVKNSFGCLSSVTRTIVNSCAPACTLPSGAGITSKTHTITSCTNASGNAVANINFNGIMGSYMSGPPPVVTSLSVSGSLPPYFNLPAAVIAYPNVSVTGATASKPGEYPVTLKICYQTGATTCCTLVTEKVIVPVIADFDYTVNCTGGGYTMNLNDQSPILSGYTLSTQSWNTTASGYAPNPSSSINLSTYTAGTVLTITHTVTVTGPAYPSGYTCTRTRTFTVPAVPNPAFTITTTDPLGPGSSSCGLREVLFTATTPGVSKWTWSFGDGTGYISDISNLATRTYTNPGSDYNATVTLTLQDAFGCTFSANQLLQIRRNTMAASTYTLATDIKCQGTASSVNLSSLSGGTTPYSYMWYKNETLMSGYSGNPISVTQDGQYWSMVTDARGCMLRANPTPAKRAFQPLPDVAITGEHDFCPNETITLSAANGTTSGLTFLWQRLVGGSWTTAGTTAVLSIPGGLAVGVHQYRVTVTQNLPSPYTGSCSAVSPVFTLTVHGKPAVPYISAPVAVNCANYSIELAVASPAAGEVYNWSNGTSGTSTIVNHGGAYRVWASNAWGCTNFADINVPLEPSYYFWRFPYGCYSYCREELPRRIDGPSYIPFTKWEWLIGGGSLPDPNGPWASAGSYSVVDPLNINLTPASGGDGNGSGIYSWYLANNLCDAFSHSMSLNLDDECCRIDAGLEYFRCEKLPGYAQPLYFGGISLGGACERGTYTIYALDPVSGLANGTVLPASGTYYGGLIDFSYQPLPGVYEVNFRVVINCDGKECRSEDIRVSLTQYPCEETKPCRMDSKWEYFQCYKDPAPYFAASAYVYSTAPCDDADYTILAVDPGTGAINGSVSPATGTLTAGGAPLTFNYHPNPGVTSVRFIILLNCSGEVCYSILGEFEGINNEERYPCKYEKSIATMSSKKDAISASEVPKNSGTAAARIRIAPNPANSDVKISFDIPEWKQNDVYRIQILNLLGQAVAEYKVGAVEGSWQYNTLQLSSGTYLVRLVKDGENVNVQRLIIAH